MKPENRVKFDKFKKKVKVCCSVFGVVVVIGMIVSIVILSILLHHLYNSDEKDNDGCLKDVDSVANSPTKNVITNSSCVDVEKRCGKNSKCFKFKNKLKKEIVACSCLQGFEGSPPNCRKHGDELVCSRNFDCPEKQTCLEGLCIDPCQGLVECGRDASCDVVKHVPICSCKFKRTGDPFSSCDGQDWTTLLVTNGVNDEEHPVTRTEVIDLTNGKRCRRKQIPDYPIGVYGSIGGLLFSERSDERIDPIICGGTMDNGLTTSACFILNNNNINNNDNNHEDRKWRPVANLTEPRSHSSVTSYPVKNSSIPEGLLVAGGRSSRRHFNSDFVSYKGLESKTWQKFVLLPKAVQSHCMLTLNSSTLILIGGRTHVGPIRETNFYDLNQQKWFAGPEMKTARSGHSCALRKVSEKSFEVVVAGGSDGSNLLNSVEILRSADMEWMPGPYLPFELEYAAAVSGGDDEVVLVGGKTRSGKSRDSILKLEKNFKWRLLKTTLEVARSSHVAILVPDNLFDC